jgi:predicted ribonuclease YlaK
LIAKMEGESIFGYVNLVKGERSELAETAAEIL